MVNHLLVFKLNLEIEILDIVAIISPTFNPTCQRVKSLQGSKGPLEDQTRALDLLTSEP